MVAAHDSNRGRVYFEYDNGEDKWLNTNDLGCCLLLTNPLVDQRVDNPKLSDVKPGSRVSVWWQSDQQFFNGTVKRVMGLACHPLPHRVIYDDGDAEWTHLAFRRFRFLDDVEDDSSKNKIKPEIVDA